jgi:hypothetical protein
MDMPKNTPASSEKFPNRKDAPLAANDNEIPKPQLAWDRAAQFEGLPQGPVRAIAESAVAAEKGSVLFVHDILAKHSPDASANVAEHTHGTEGVMDNLRHAFADNDQVVVLGATELRETGIDLSGHDVMGQLTHLAQELREGGKTVVVDVDPLRDPSFAPAWSKLETKLGESAMGARGAAAEEWLLQWMERAASGKPVEGEPTLEEVFATCKDALEAVGHLSTKLGTSVVLGQSGSPLSLALFLVAATGSLSAPVAREMLGKAHEAKQQTEFISVTGNRITTSWHGHRTDRTR